MLLSTDAVTMVTGGGLLKRAASDVSLDEGRLRKLRSPAYSGLSAWLLDLSVVPYVLVVLYVGSKPQHHTPTAK